MIITTLSIKSCCINSISNDCYKSVSLIVDLISGVICNCIKWEYVVNAPTVLGEIVNYENVPADSLIESGLAATII